jgi:hypothetical protein
MEMNMPITKTSPPIHGERTSNTPTPTAREPTTGRAIAASIRPRLSLSSWLRDSGRLKTTARTAGPAPGANTSAQRSVVIAATMVTQVSRSERKIRLVSVAFCAAVLLIGDCVNGRPEWTRRHTHRLLMVACSIVQTSNAHRSGLVGNV